VAARLALDELCGSVYRRAKAWGFHICSFQSSRAARYQAMFGQTHAFLPERNGIRPNTLHVILHAATLTTLVVLGALTTAHEQP
jgi:hypothetical protein